MLDRNGKKHVFQAMEDVLCSAHYKQFVPALETIGFLCTKTYRVFVVNIFEFSPWSRNFVSFLASFRELIRWLCVHRKSMISYARKLFEFSLFHLTGLG